MNENYSEFLVNWNPLFKSTDLSLHRLSC